MERIGEISIYRTGICEMKLFSRISEEDMNLLGFSPQWCKPEWLICTVFPVPPPAVRPSVKQNNSQRMDDDLTHKLSDIVKFNNTLKEKIDNNAPKFNK